jgi:hypothetical protein
MGKVTYTISITFTHKIWGLTKDRFLLQRCHWHRCDENRRFHSRFSSRIRNHIQKGFNPCIRGLGGVVRWKKNQRSKISCQGPFNSRGIQVERSRTTGEIIRPPEGTSLEYKVFRKTDCPAMRNWGLFVCETLEKIVWRNSTLFLRFIHNKPHISHRQAVME